MKHVSVAKESDAAAAQENNGRVLGLCDLQGSSWSQTSANLQTLFLLLAGPAMEQGAGGAVARILCSIQALGDGCCLQHSAGMDTKHSPYTEHKISILNSLENVAFS